MEFNRKADGSLEKLPAKHVDTGMGFERLCMAMQGVTSNYDTDVFTPLIEKVEQITGFKYVPNTVTPSAVEEKTNIAIRVIVDHVRAVAFAIADGQLPSNTGAGYVIRRILRRAIRYGFTFLNTKEPFIYKLVEVLAVQMGEFFPEIKSQQQLVTNVIREEEASFLRTLDKGLDLLEEVITNTTTTTRLPEVSGAKAFELYDTYGFPKDLTALILKEKGMSFSEAEFDASMEEQKSRSRAASKVKAGDWQILIDDPEVEFLGYDYTEANVKITRYRKVESAKEGEIYQLVFNMTPFYPEGGGQIGDTGVLEAANGDVIYIIDTKKENNLIIHFTKELPTNLSEIFKVIVGPDRRRKSAANHSATHLMHLGLRTILGTHVEQKGSLVNPNYLRFDFSHFAKVTDEEIKKVEHFVNTRIEAQLQLVEHRSIPIQQAMAQGAMALFGEKYGENVRMIEFGESKELCGGIHVKNTADIWHFKIISEGAVAAGIRRIEAITGDAVKAYFSQQETDLEAIKETLKNPQDTLKAVVALQDENAKLKKQMEQLLKEKAKGLKNELAFQLQDINGIKFLATQVDLNPEGAKDLAYELGTLGTNIFLVLATANEDKPMLSCYISKELVAEKNLNAGTVVRELGKYIQGSGGGQPFFATAGGKYIEGIKVALGKAIDFVKKT
jgi:alanyl-tRNA synthetase